MPTAFENELFERSIVLPNSKSYHPQTNWKMERWFRTLEAEMAHFERSDGFVEFYNERRKHCSLDMKYGDVQGDVRGQEGACNDRRADPKWVEKHISD